MRYAIGVFMDDFVADAEQGDYSIFEEGAIACPFCRESLFWRKGHTKKGGKITVRPSFCHRPNGESDGSDCELRSERKEGLEYIQSLKIQSRNQRLERVEARFIEIFDAKFEYTKKEHKQNENLIGKKFAQKKASALRRAMRSTLMNSEAFCRRRVKEVMAQYCTFEKDNDNLTELVRLGDNELAYIFRSEVGENLVPEWLHHELCFEVLLFISSPTSRNIFRRVFAYLLGAATWDSLMADHPGIKDYKTDAMVSFVDRATGEVVDRPSDWWMNAIVGVLVQIDWSRQLSRDPKTYKMQTHQQKYQEVVEAEK